MEEEENWQFLNEVFSEKKHISLAHLEENLTAVRTILSKTLQFAVQDFNLKAILDALRISKDKMLNLHIR